MKTPNAFNPKDEKELDKSIKDYANKVGLKINPDKEKFELIKKGLWRNKEKHGEVYCPCRVVTGNKKKDGEIVCPCVFHRGEIELQGHCRCLLFFDEKS